MGIKNIYAPENVRLVHYLEESLKAKALFKLDKDYVVKNGEIIIVDEFTGRLLHGRRYNGGLHQAIEAKENVHVKEESRTYAKISIQNYFRMYKKISGMTGTAQTSAEEFHKVYGLEVISIPTNRPLVRKDNEDLIYKNSEAKWRAVITDIKAKQEAGQPVLVGTTSIEKNEHVSELLSGAGIKHELLNAKNNEREGAIIAQAGRAGAVTVATNMAGRGVDIVLGGNPSTKEEQEKVKALGGLHVVGTERHEARRIDNQLRGRAGRQGDPGSTQFYLSLDDDLLRIFGGERIQAMMDRFDIPEDQPIEMGFVSKAVAQAQSKVEGANFDMRKHLLEYDDVLNKQRSVVYQRRTDVLDSVRKGELSKIIYDASAAFLDRLERLAESMPESAITNGALKDLVKNVMPQEGELISMFDEAPRDEPVSPNMIDNIKEALTKRSLEASLHPQAVQMILGIIDSLWMAHLENLDALSDAVGLRAYGQRDPLAEYRGEARRLYETFWEQFNDMVFGNVIRLASQVATRDTAGMNKPGEADASSPILGSGGNTGKVPDGQFKEVGRNDPCPCGSGKKYKKCHGK
jgi:preprotein translocase subunit SecA